MSSVMSTASGPCTGVAGAAAASCSARTPVLRTPVPAPRPCRNPRLENALFCFLGISFLGELTSDLPFYLVFDREYRCEPRVYQKRIGRATAVWRARAGPAYLHAQRGAGILGDLF